MNRTVLLSRIQFIYRLSSHSYKFIALQFSKYKHTIHDFVHSAFSLCVSNCSMTKVCKRWRSQTQLKVFETHWTVWKTVGMFLLSRDILTDVISERQCFMCVNMSFQISRGIVNIDVSTHQIQNRMSFSNCNISNSVDFLFYDFEIKQKRFIIMTIIIIEKLLFINTCNAPKIKIQERKRTLISIRFCVRI